MFKGVLTALITPFRYNQFDVNDFEKHIHWQIDSAVHGLVVCGSTGEAQTLTRDEYTKIITSCIEITDRRIPVIAGASSSSTRDAIELAHIAKSRGADAIMVSAPYYNKPTQEGIYQHYKAINEAVEIPILLYNVPGRCAVDISDETIIRLSKLSNVVGIKDASGDLGRVTNIYNHVDRNFSLLSGDDNVALAFNAQGGVGCVSVASNIVPGLCSKIQNLMLEGNFLDAFSIHQLLSPLYDVLFCETNPVPIKYMCSLIDICSPDVRLPLVPLTERNKKIVRDEMCKLQDNIKLYEQRKEYCSPKS